MPEVKKISKQTLESLNAGDERALGLVYDCFAKRLVRHATIRCSDEEIAKDLVHGIFLKLWEYICGGGAVEHPQAFLYKSLHNALVDHYRGAHREVELPYDEAGLAPPDEHDITFEIDRDFAGAGVRAAIDALRPEHKSVLLMRYMEELTMDEISEATGKTKNALYVLIHRATKDLRELLVKGINGNTGKTS